jgi:protein-tyrosine phosphatase
VDESGATGGTWPRGRARDGGIDAIPVTSGQLWLCGRRAVGPDADAALARVGADTIVCLSERHELELRYPHYVEWLELHAGSRAVWHPIPDLHAPAFDRASALVSEVVARLHAGEGLVMHCGAGIGRAGTIAVCVLMRMGDPLPAALATVASSRPSAGPEVGAQQALVERFSRVGDAAEQR